MHLPCGRRHWGLRVCAIADAAAAANDVHISTPAANVGVDAVWRRTIEQVVSTDTDWGIFSVV